MGDPKTVLSEAREPSFNSRTALLIGDDSEVESALSTVLAPEGWKLEQSGSLDDALVLAKSRQFDLIVTSRKTSGNQDVEFLRRLRRVRPHTRIIILTDDGTPADVIASMREHAFGYLSKGFSVESLAETVRTVMETPTWDDGIEIMSATPNLITLAVRCTMVAAERLLQFMREVTDLPEEE